MGSCHSAQRIEKREEELMLDDYYDQENMHHGDQSWLFYQIDSEQKYYESEFQLERTVKENKSGFSIRSKIKSLRNSFFNPDKHEEKMYRTPYALRRDSRGGFTEKVENWRRSWFGYDPTPKPNRRLSLKKKEDEEKQSKSSSRMSESALKRRSVTRSFVEKYENAEDLYSKNSKSPVVPQSPAQKKSENFEVQAMVSPRRPSLKRGEVVEEDEISESTVKHRSIDREILEKIKEVASIDYVSSESEEDVSKLTEAFNEEMKQNEEKKEDTIYVEDREEGDGTEDTTKTCEETQNEEMITTQVGEVTETEAIQKQGDEELEEVNEEWKEVQIDDEKTGETKDSIEELEEEISEKKTDVDLQAGVELFNDECKADTEEEIAKNITDSKEEEDEVIIKEEEAKKGTAEDEEPKYNKSSTIHVSRPTTRISAGSKIVISSKSNRN